MEKRLEDFNLDDLFSALETNVKKDIVSFEDLVDLDRSLKRELYLGDIVDGVGTSIEGCIRFWNQQDEDKNIPIEKREPIKIFINSPGGSLTETFTMIDAIRLSKTPVYTIATGPAYSGGFFTFIAGHKKFAYPHASFLYHEGSVGNAADASKFRNFADFYSKQLNQLKDITLKYTKITPEEYQEHIKDDWWFTAEEALKYGICDVIIGEKNNGYN